MKSLILHGAFDRYNYGDNLMPLLFEEFLKQWHPDIHREYRLVYSALRRSDLSRYSCAPTTPIKEALKGASKGSAVIVAGGGVMAMKTAPLLTHYGHPWVVNFVIRNSRKLAGNLIDIPLCRIFGAGWEFPYSIPKEVIDLDIKVAYNSVGGDISRLPLKEQDLLLDRFQYASYMAVRDSFAASPIIGRGLNCLLSPDSATAMSALDLEQLLDTKVRDEIKQALTGKYFVFQSAPHKLPCTISSACEGLERISKETGGRIVLLPIGYASGHDDVRLMRKMKAVLSDSILLDDLNVWEILYVIKSSEAYLGSSLHGAITAFSFGRHHFSVNNGIKKFRNFLKDWSVPEYQAQVKFDDLDETIETMMSRKSDDFGLARQYAVSRTMENNNKLLQALVG